MARIAYDVYLAFAVVALGVPRVETQCLHSVFQRRFRFVQAKVHGGKITEEGRVGARRMKAGRRTHRARWK